jgi:hypothetical protein
MFLWHDQPLSAPFMTREQVMLFEPMLCSGAVRLTVLSSTRYDIMAQIVLVDKPS